MIDASIIEEIKENVNWLESQIEGMQIPSNHRNTIAAALYSIALEQGSGIILLIENLKYAPASSLLRVTFESLVRGKWIQMAAKQNFVEKIDLKKFPKQYSQIKQIEIENNDIGKTILSFKNRTDNILNDYTHSGQRAIVRRISGSRITPNYDPLEVLEILSLSRSFCFIAATSICDLADNEEISKRIYFRFKDLMPIIDSKQ
ncbi:MAG: hypothetical protein CMN55_14230 [Sneathiella sp.]|jgi:hypothetical protein|uniref:DUF6988 family protein n=1 Tax=Sneathiella sp. TaxID=1964365 RepID=UPI000C49A047|nr:DUF5677 domain-containing protein [Sneathiella sp.]MAL80241.1 hypothetical protein [Sneathiella sp.]|tara:strand:+ start:837 stop:1445 length:609 start_codon:yes stop_codon:yes gene_type:complete